MPSIAPVKPKKKNIFDYIENNDAEGLKQHIAQNPDSMNEREDAWNATPLIMAAYYGKNDCVEALIQAGAELDTQDKDGDTALTSAAKMGQYNSSKLLLDAGADITIRTNSGKTAKTIAKTDEIKNLITRQTAGQYIKEGEYLVSITECAEGCDLTIKTLFNFQAKTITTHTHSADNTTLLVQDFANNYQQTQVQKAANFLKSKDGDLHGFRVQPVF